MAMATVDKVALWPAETDTMLLVWPRLGSGQELPEPYFPPSLDTPSLASRTPEKVMVLEMVLAQAQLPTICFIQTGSPFFNSSMR